ncbi:MAG: DUF898 family protein [Shimia sp.]
MTEATPWNGRGTGRGGSDIGAVPRPDPSDRTPWGTPRADAATDGPPPVPDGWHREAVLPDERHPGTFEGRMGAVAWLALRTGFWTILTLGLYRFWAKTKLRRYYWSSVRIGGWPLEYVGTPWEKLLGFLYAVVLVAFYLGIVNLILMFVSFSLLAAPGAAYGLSLLGVVPLWFFAQYRARRYVLARTRWRGLRFGLAPGAWGYARRAALGWLAVVLTLGLSHPALRFRLTKYRNDRTFFGTARLRQGGTTGMLYPASVQMFLAGALTLAIASTGLDALADDIAPSTEGLWLLVVTIPWFGYGLAVYVVDGKRLMAEALTAEIAPLEERSDESAPKSAEAPAKAPSHPFATSAPPAPPPAAMPNLGLAPAPSPARIAWIHLSGNALRLTAIIVALAGLGIALGIGLAASGFAPEAPTEIDPEIDPEADPIAALTALLGGPSTALVTAGLAAIYFGLFLMWSTLTHAFLTQRVWRHYAETLALTGVAALVAVAQRPRDAFAEAEGFAEALDVGGAL